MLSSIILDRVLLILSVAVYTDSLWGMPYNLATVVPLPCMVPRKCPITQRNARVFVVSRCMPTVCSLRLLPKARIV